MTSQIVEECHDDDDDDDDDHHHHHHHHHHHPSIDKHWQAQDSLPGLGGFGVSWAALSVFYQHMDVHVSSILDGTSESCLCHRVFYAG